jgi:hypothetical protein
MMVSRFSILFGMSTTTIKVDSVTRDRLAYLARARGTTMSALLSDVAERLETEQRWCDIEAAYERMQREDPVGGPSTSVSWPSGRSTPRPLILRLPRNGPSTTSEGRARSGLVGETGPHGSQ